MRTEIDNLLAAKILFEADRTCCVCRTRGIPVQLHHIDGDHSNSVEENLSVLCVHCHDLTMIRGGFGRKLDATQVMLYKSDWIQLVARDRSERCAQSKKESSRQKIEIGKLIDEIEELKANGDIDQIIFILNSIGNSKLRDEYIETYVQENPADIDSKLFFRHMQGRMDLLDQSEIDAFISDLKKDESWEQVARALIKTGKNAEAAEYYLRGIMNSLSEERSFSAAYYLKEMAKNKLHIPMFERAYRESRQRGDIWWEYRSLQELGHNEEIAALLKREGVQTGQELLQKATNRELFD